MGPTAGLDVVAKRDFPHLPAVEPR